MISWISLQWENIDIGDRCLRQIGHVADGFFVVKFFRLGLVLSRAVSDTSDMSRTDSIFTNDLGSWMPDPIFGVSSGLPDYYRFEKRNNAHYSMDPQTENIAYYKRAVPLLSSFYV